MKIEESSYEVTEDTNEVTILILLNRPSSKPFDLSINIMNLTVECK